MSSIEWLDLRLAAEKKSLCLAFLSVLAHQDHHRRSYADRPSATQAQLRLLVDHDLGESFLLHR